MYDLTLQWLQKAVDKWIELLMQSWPLLSWTYSVQCENQGLKDMEQIRFLKLLISTA